MDDGWTEESDANRGWRGIYCFGKGGRARLSAPSKRLEIKFTRERMRGTVIPDDVVRVHELISEARFKNMRFEFDWMMGKFNEIDNAGQGCSAKMEYYFPGVPGRYLNPLETYRQRREASSRIGGTC